MSICLFFIAHRRLKKKTALLIRFIFLALIGSKIPKFQPIYRTNQTSPTRYIKTHHIPAPSITPQRPNNFNPHDFNHYPLLIYIYFPHVILTEIIILIVMD
jgi:hypothetical protein